MSTPTARDAGPGVGGFGPGAAAQAGRGGTKRRTRPVDHLGAGALATYQEAGWRTTEHGNLDAGQRVGPCTGAGCGALTVRYGPGGAPLCKDCEGGE